MNGNNIYIEKNNLLDAYKNGDADNKKFLENLFGKELFRSKNIMDRVKTIEDAMRELGEEHPLVQQYRYWMSKAPVYDGTEKDLIAFLKLRIITAALNEGWTPQFTENEYRYYPWFWLYTQEELDKMNKEERKKVVLFGGPANYGAPAGFACAYSSHAPTSATATIGSRLCFKSSALAKYAGEQFAEIYFAFVGK